MRKSYRRPSWATLDALRRAQAPEPGKRRGNANSPDTKEPTHQEESCTSEGTTPVGRDKSFDEGDLL